MIISQLDFKLLFIKLLAIGRIIQIIIYILERQYANLTQICLIVGKWLVGF